MRIQIPLKVSTATYAAGRVVGGLINLTGYLRSPSLPTAVVGAVLMDKSRSDSVYDLFFYEGMPKGSYGDNSVFNADPIDDPKTVNSMPLSGMILRGSGSGIISVRNIYVALGAIVEPWGLLVCRDSTTYVTPNDLTLSLFLENLQL